MKKIISTLLFVALGIFFFVWALRYIGLEEMKNVLFSFSIWEGLVILSLTILARAVETLRWKKVLEKEGYSFSFKELFGPNLIYFGAYYFVPLAFLGADLLRGYSLKGKKGITREKRMASVLIDRLSATLPAVLTIGSGTLIFLLKANLLMDNIEKIFFIALLAIAFFWYVRKRAIEEKSILRVFLKIDENNLGRKVEKEVLKYFRVKNPYLLKTIGLSFARIFIEMVQCWLLFFFLGKNMSFTSLIAVLGVSLGSMEIPVSADLGSHDWIMVFVSQRLGFGKGAGIAFSSILRVSNIITAFWGLWFLSRLWVGKWQDKIFESVEKLSELINNNHKRKNGE